MGNTVFPQNSLTAEMVRAIVREELAALRQEQTPETWTIDQACEYLHISRTSYHRLVLAGALHPRKVGARSLLVPDEVRSLVESGSFVKFHHDKRK